MAYQGYLIKVGDYTIPLSMMAANTYKTLRSGQDLDSTRNEDGELNRNALDHFLNKVEFETPAYKDDKQMSAFLDNIRRNFIDVTEQSVMVECYVPLLNEYVTQKMYVPDITFTIARATDTFIKYERARVAFIAY